MTQRWQSKALVAAIAEPGLAAALPELVCLRLQRSTPGPYLTRVVWERVELVCLEDEAPAIQAAYALGGLEAVRAYTSGGSE